MKLLTIHRAWSGVVCKIRLLAEEVKPLARFGGVLLSFLLQQAHLLQALLLQALLLGYKQQSAMVFDECTN
jgi:hypothetical protein